MTRFGYNVLRLDNEHRERLWQHAARLPDGCMLMYNHMGETTYEFRRDFPRWLTIHRAWPDHQDHLQDTPSAWYRRNANRGRDGVIIHTVNEVAITDQLFDWSTELTRIARPDGTRFVHINAAVGIPEPHDWTRPAARRFLEEIAKDGDRHYVGLHEYWPSNPTGLMRGTSLQNPVIQNPDQWPKSLEDAFPGWLCGRYHFLHLACDEMGIPRPKILLTEVGTAEIGAVDAWQKALPKTQGYFNLDGWLANREIWQQWWPQWSHETAYARQMLYLLQSIWTGVDAAIVFGWGDSGGWAAFDVADAVEFQSAMEAGLRFEPMPIPVPAPTPQPVEVPFPTEGFEPVILTPADGAFNVRHQPQITAEKAFRVDETQRGEIALNQAVLEGSMKWYPIKVSGVGSGWAREDVFGFLSYIPEPPLRILALTETEWRALQTAGEILRSKQ